MPKAEYTCACSTNGVPIKQIFFGTDPPERCPKCNRMYKKADLSHSCPKCKAPVAVEDRLCSSCKEYIGGTR